ncbi:hypothetical protein BKA58DRAFT_404107 [Alternaria rosae]|uniref:uncharacterized protein n=1 Tax=Alternaria rosae TaxID=1187941 RepID=UPI001E8D9232|nr:uncharacterized protein BKA58DRAFT_404107 [Alternaria rosae]KAH6865531.1 hypothetical protein BKA58DRAFT_404107 [Alternaria rosae]
MRKACSDDEKSKMNERQAPNTSKVRLLDLPSVPTYPFDPLAWPIRALLRTNTYRVVSHQVWITIRGADGGGETWWSRTLETYEGDRPLFRPLSVRHHFSQPEERGRTSCSPHEKHDGTHGHDRSSTGTNDRQSDPDKVSKVLADHCIHPPEQHIGSRTFPSIVQSAHTSAPHELDHTGGTIDRRPCGMLYRIALRTNEHVVVYIRQRKPGQRRRRKSTQDDRATKTGVLSALPAHTIRPSSNTTTPSNPTLRPLHLTMVDLAAAWRKFVAQPLDQPSLTEGKAPYCFSPGRAL